MVAVLVNGLHTIGIVAHVDRVEMAHKLADWVRPKLVNVDDGTLGCAGNHAHVLSKLAEEPGWSVVLEDDAVPLNDFEHDLRQVLELAPEPIVSLYLGTGYPAEVQKRIFKAMEANTSWITSNRFIHAVGYAIAPEIKVPLARWMTKSRRGPGMAPDTAINIWANKHGYRVAYTNPQLVDHRDTRSVILTRVGRNRPRHAHNPTPRALWDRSSVEL